MDKYGSKNEGGEKKEKVNQKSNAFKTSPYFKPYERWMSTARSQYTCYVESTGKQFKEPSFGQYLRPVKFSEDAVIYKLIELFTELKKANRIYENWTHKKWHVSWVFVSSGVCFKIALAILFKKCHSSQDYKNPGSKGLLNISAQYTFVDVFPSDQIALIQDLLDNKTGLDTFPLDIFRAAKRRLLNSTLLMTLHALPEYERLPQNLKEACINFNSLAVSRHCMFCSLEATCFQRK
jgi:hypothetical protein